MYSDENEPCYVISIAARMVGVHAQTLRYYERVGILAPSRSRGRIRLYSQADINRIRQVQRLIDDLGVNLAGAEVIIDMSAHHGAHPRMGAVDVVPFVPIAGIGMPECVEMARRGGASWR